MKTTNEYTEEQRRAMQEYKRPFIERVNAGDIVQELGLRKAKAHGYVCPVCGSGNGPKATGAEVTRDRRRITCYSTKKDCPLNGDGHGQDIFGALKITTGKSENELLKERFPDYDIRKALSADRQQPPAQDTRREARAAAAPKDYTEQYKAWNTFLLQDSKALAYLESRGITRETAEAFMLGYCPDWAHPANVAEYGERAERSPRLIIPRSRHDYTARRIDGRGEKKYQVVGRQGVLFNAKVGFKDRGDKAPVVVVEGELDALSIYQCGYKAVVALGTSTAYKDFVEQAKAEYPAATYILALDNDDAGRGAQTKVQELMDNAGLHYIAADTAQLYGEAKDASEAVQADKARFWEVLTEYTHQGGEQRQQRDQAADLEAYYRTGAGMVDFFLQDIQSEKYHPISTGFPCIDKALNGGFFRQTLVTVGAAPGMGKTALVSQISENLAKDGHSVLYINLEMSRQQMLARSLARISNNVLHRRISVNEIMRGYAWTDATRQLVEDAAAEYKDDIADDLIYNPGQQQTTDLDEIMETIEQEQARIGRAPVVVVDYLQLLSSQTGGKADDAVTTIKKAVQTLKTYAIKQDTVVIAITANNRASMKTGESNLYSGRDTSALEFSADQQIGLEYRAVGDRDDKKTLDEITDIRRDYFKDPSDKVKESLFRQYACQIALKVNKNRWGAADTTALLYFDGASSTFTPLDTYHQEPPGMQGVTAYKYNASGSGPEWENMELLP